MLVLDTDGCYRVATPAQEQAWREQCQERLAQRDAMEQQRMALRQTRQAQQRIANDTLQPHLAEIPVIGTERGVLLLIEYPDLKFSMDDPLQHFTDMMMKPGYDYAYNATTKYRHNGSVHEYFYDSSGGLFDLQMDVFGPICMPDSVKHYAANKDRLAWEMIVKGCEAIDDSVDFSQYDQDGDGRIDFIASFYAGPGSNASGVSEADAIWPHQWTITSAGGGQHYVDSVLIDTYVCVNETYGGRPDGMGTFCHEFSHILGLPDLYYSSNCTPGEYDLMDNGAYLLNGYRPCAFSAYERYELGWLQPTLLSEAGVYSLQALTMQNEAFIVPVTADIADPRQGEYYLFENRQPYAWDEYMPGHGLLAWHIDYVSSRWNSNTPNSWSSHQCVDLIEADGQKKSGGRYTNDGSETFPGTANHTSFTDDTTPAFSGWTYSGRNMSELTNRLEKPIYNITEVELTDEERPENAKQDIALYQVRFDFMEEFSAIKEVRITNSTSGSARIEMIDGRAVIKTAQGCYDMQGVRL